MFIDLGTAMGVVFNVLGTATQVFVPAGQAPLPGRASFRILAFASCGVAPAGARQFEDPSFLQAVESPLPGCANFRILTFASKQIPFIGEAGGRLGMGVRRAEPPDKATRKKNVWGVQKKVSTIDIFWFLRGCPSADNHLGVHRTFCL